MKEHDVVQFTEGHKWCGSLGIITKIKEYKDHARIMVGVPIPLQGTAYIFCTADDIELIGQAKLVPDDRDE